MSKRTPLSIGDYSIKQDDVFMVGDSEIEQKGLVAHHIESMNDQYTRGIPEIITTIFKIEKKIENERETTPEDKEIKTIDISVQFTDVFTNRPTTVDYNSGKEKPLFPRGALIKDKTYSGNLSINAKITAIAYLKNGTVRKREDKVEKFKICRVPILVKSILCNTHGCSKESLKQLKEDPEDPGGYFIVKGVEWVIDNIENVLINDIRVFKNMFNKEVYRAEFRSKPGDGYQNQSYLVVRWLNDGQITCEIMIDKYKGIYFPFYLIYRLLGWNRDKDVFDHIVEDYSDPNAVDFMNYLKDAFTAKYTHMPEGKYAYSQEDALRVISDTMKIESYAYMKVDEFPDNYKNLHRSIFRSFDKTFLPHIGTETRSRSKKLKFLSMIIRKIFLVARGVVEPTDRDSYRSKRIHAAGMSFAKIIKTYFNAAIVLQIRRKFVKDFRAMPFSQVNLANTLKSSIFGADFERLLVQSITSGNKSELKIHSRRTVVNRLSSQLMHRKNTLNTLAILRQVTAANPGESSKQSERANRMRRVHMSFLGYICVSHSPEGPKVGINKQMSLFTSICKSSSSEIIKKVLREDPLLFPEEKVSILQKVTHGLSRIFVNGDPVAYTRNALDFARRYRTKRRRSEILPYTTIHWVNTEDQVYIWTDPGRVIIPRIIVYNNKRDPDVFPKGDAKKPFRQGIALTQSHIDKLYQKRISIEDLVKEGIVEYISAEEAENCYVCPSFDRLRENKSNELRPYTHCGIPEEIFGLSAHTSPFGNHNQAVRVVFQTGKTRQACGLYALNWPYRIDKSAFIQYDIETPLISTVANKYMNSNGMNAIVAFMCNTSYNVEDSLIMSQGAIDRGLFNCSKFKSYKTELDQKEEFSNPDISTTTDIKSADYSKLKDGILQVGATVKNGDAIIGKHVKISKGNRSDSKYIYSDRSYVYREKEVAHVQAVVVGRNEDDEKFVKIGLRKSRPVAIGDKFSSCHGQKGIIGLILRDSEMPSTADGMRPDLIINPHALPSRMTIAQLIESMLGNYCAHAGTRVDGTIFRKPDLEGMAEKLKKLGVDEYGYHRMYNGITGEWIDAMIFMGPSFYQRLQKFVVDEVYSITHGPSDALTLQPLEGKGNHGGLKLGEMEVWCMGAHGAPRFISEKFRDHSDGYDWPICRCGKPAVVNEYDHTYVCNECGDDADILKIPTTWSSKLLMQELDTMNVGVRMYPKPYTYEKYLEYKK